MDQFEMVEKLREKAQVSYEDARQALEASSWDLLDALVYLEKAGKVQGSEAASYSTRPEQRQQRTSPPEGQGKGTFARLMDGFVSVINSANRVSVEVIRKSKVVLTLPLLVVVLLAVFMFWWVAPIAVIALFFGYTYRFKGSPAVEGVNRAMDKAASMAENIKSGARDADDTAD